MDSSYGKERSAELQYEDSQFDEETPRSELPPSVDGWDHMGRDAAASGSLSSVSAIDYFSTTGASRPDLSHTSSSPAPSVGINEAAAAGHIQLPSRSRSVRSIGRPSAQTAISSLSVLSTDSTVTVRPNDAVQILEYVSEHPPFVQAPYPNQSYAALHEQYHPIRGNFALRRVGSQPFHNASNSASAMAIKHASGARSSNNTPTLSAGLFNLPPQPERSPSEHAGTYASPYLHYTHTHVPKETHIADVDVDPISGRKLINHYEIIDELGRGTHGKVKLGRDLQQDNSYVAIKIVERFSRRRRLGKLGTTENKVKKEVAILKKVRHPNVVALLEVIDDPTRKKVYIVLEWVEKGEIYWRAKAAPEVAMVEARRYARERSGRTDARSIAEDDAVFAEAEKQLARKKRRQARAYKLTKKGLSDADHGWSLEMAGDSDGDSDDDSRSLSRVSTATTDSFQSRHPGATGGRRSRQSSRVSSHGDNALSGSPGQYLPLTSEPVYGSPEDRRPLTARSGGPESGLFSNYEFGSAPVSRGASLTSMRSVRRSSDDLVRFSKEVLNSELDPELAYVPVMTIDKIRVAFRDTLLGLRYLHYQGIVHRDIKPPNLLATGQGRVKISDFGVSYLGRPVHEGERGEDLSEADTQDLDDEAKELAKTVGTPAFYAPEMCNTDPNEQSLPVTKAIDVWALGITLFCMLFARTPFVDDQYVVMRQIADEEVYLPRQRLCPISPKSTSRANSGSRAAASDVSEYRHELDLIYEPISDDLHDLLQRLLTKDPRQRITLEQVRLHPWVLADLPNSEKWLEETDISRQSEGKKIDVSKREVDDAVVPLSLVERVRGSIKKATAILGGLGGRKRADSSASNSPAPSIADDTPMREVPEVRRESVQDDQDLAVYERLRASRGWHKGQAQSELVQKIDSERDRRPSTTHVYHFGNDESGDEQDYDTRPYPSPPSRANTMASAATSMATVRQSDYRKSVSGGSRSSSPGFAANSLVPAPNTGNHLGGIFGGATRRIVNSVRERASHGSLHRVRSHDAHSVHSIESVDPHSEPSVAVSPAVAEAQLDPFNALGEYSFAENALNNVTHTPSAQRSGRESVASSRPPSTLASPDQPYHTQEHYGFLTRNSSGSSMASTSRKSSLAALFRPKEQPPRSNNETTNENWKRVDEEHIRRAVQRSKADAARAVSPRRTYDSPEPTNCPPSPDDSKVKHENSLSAVPSLTDSSIPETPPGASPGTNATHLPAALPPSSYDLGSTVSIAVSDPPAHSVASEDPSFDAAESIFFNSRRKRSPSSDDTVDPATCILREPVRSVHPANENFDENTNDDDDDDDEYESSSDSDGGLVMSRRKSSARAAAAQVQQLDAGGATAGSQDLSAGAPSTRKSSRSGSNNTMKKVRTHDSYGTPQQAQRGRIPFDLGDDDDDDE